MTTEHLRFAPEILRRLGEELVPHADLGILELVRNAYDADATRCVISLQGVEDPGGTITIEDDGDGMDPETIRSGWLLLGKSSKTGSKYTRSGRRKVGEKGLGRLAALRMGDRVSLVTRPNGGRQGHQFELQIHWRDFDTAEAVDDVDLELQKTLTRAKSGTSIEISGLRERLTHVDLRRLSRSLLMLTGPFPAENSFQAVLEAPEFAEFEKLVRDAYFSEYEYLIRGSVDSDGRASATLTDWNGTTLATGALPAGERGDGEAIYECPSADFELYSFNLSKASFDVRRSAESVGAVKEWLREVGGVHLYQRDLRVGPYGDPGHDWLEMNLRRARSPELRPSTNTAIGRVVVRDEYDILIPKTDRTGFIENEAFSELRRFGGDVLEWAAIERLRIREKGRDRDRKRAPKDIKAATAQVRRAVQNVPREVRPQLQQAVDQYQIAVDKQLRSTAEDVLLYRTLGTVGTIAAVFAHETLRPVATIEQIADSLQLRMRRDLPNDYERSYGSAIDRIKQSAAALRTFSELPLRMLARNKRRLQRVDVATVCRNMLNTFDPYLGDLGITVDAHIPNRPLLTWGNITSLEAVLANLIANSAHFVDQVPSEDRRIELRVEPLVNRIRIVVADSGGGIRGIPLEDIWLPGRSTRVEGSGLGLTIVRDSITDLGGTITAQAEGSAGGAEFSILLPYANDDEPPSLLDPGENQ